MDESSPLKKRADSGFCLEKLKNDYLPLQVKYNLPNFDELNKDFQIERVSDGETDFILREIRKFIADKLQNYLRFIEAILNPTEASMFIFMVIKSVNGEDKKKFTEIYKELAKINFDLLELDVEYSEEKEANFIKRAYNLWERKKGELLIILDSMNNNWGNGIEFRRGDYFG